MDKDQFPLFVELAVDAGAEVSGVTVRRKFAGTDNPRHLRVIQSLMFRPRKREEIDRIAGASNGPELIAELRRRGLQVKCKLTPGIDRDGYPIKFGIYGFDDEDRRAVKAWLSNRSMKAKV